MRHLDLFTGIGGFTLAAQNVWGKDYEPVAFCEIDKFCQKVLRKHWPDVEIANDIKDSRIKQFKDIDLLTAGVPCQPASVAGAQRGTTDERWLWSETLAIIRDVRPQWALLENVPGLFSLENGSAFNGILSGLAEIGYDCWWETIPACAVGAPHRRDRIWIVAWNTHCQQSQTFRKMVKGQNTKPNRSNRNTFDSIGQCSKLSQRRDLDRQILHQKQREEITDTACRPNRNVANTKIAELDRDGIARQGWNGFANNNSNAADATGTGLENSESRGESTLNGKTRNSSQRTNLWNENWFEVATRLCRMDDGIPNRVDRLKSLGNAIVPQCAMVIMQVIKDIEANR